MVGALIVCAPPVSIPFIAGQWSLRGKEEDHGKNNAGFNPLHCGAVVASLSPPKTVYLEWEFQSPSLRGSGRFARQIGVLDALQAGFNPLHCGAVVASKAGAEIAEARVFQSPSLRGSGRFRR